MRDQSLDQEYYRQCSINQWEFSRRKCPECLDFFEESMASKQVLTEQVFLTICIHEVMENKSTWVICTTSPILMLRVIITVDRKIIIYCLEIV